MVKKRISRSVPRSKEIPGLKYSLAILIFVLLLSACADSHRDTSNSEIQPEPFYDALLSEVFHDCHHFYNAPLFPWECCSDEVDRLKDFSSDTIKYLLRDHKYADSLIADEDVYSVLNIVISSRILDSAPDSNGILIQQETFTHYKSLNYDALTRYYPELIDKNDVLFLYSQLSCESFFFDEQKMIGVKCIPTSELKTLFCIAENSPKDSIRRILKKGREGLKKKYGQEYVEQYSKPVFNSAKTFAIVEHCSALWGELIFLRKMNNRWKIIITMDTWIS